MKFWKKFKPSRVLRKASEPGHHTHAIEGAMVRVEPRPASTSGFKRGSEEVNHLILYATNGYVLARIDLGVQESGDEPGPIPLPALRHMEAGVTARLDPKEIQVGITHYDRVFVDHLLADPPSEESFPEWDKILERQGVCRDPTGVDHLTLDVNPRRLLAAAEAIGEPDGVKITLDLRKATPYPKQKRRWYRGPLRIRPRDDFYRIPHSEALLMPMLPFGVEKDPEEK